MINKILFDRKGRKYFWSSGDLQTSLGLVKEKEIQEATTEVADHYGNKLTVYTANWMDSLEKLKRGPQIMLPKDIGLILAYTGIDKNSTVLDAGLGSGGLSSFLARFTKKVIAYERNQDHLKNAKKNLEKLNITNIEIKELDVYETIEDTNLDLITLDVMEPWKALPQVTKALKPGAYCVCYIPNVTQMSSLVNEAANHDFLVERCVEGILREWEVSRLIARPKHQQLAHTAFLVFLRKQ